MAVAYTVLVTLGLAQVVWGAAILATGRAPAQMLRTYGSSRRAGGYLLCGGFGPVLFALAFMALDGVFVVPEWSPYVLCILAGTIPLIAFIVFRPRRA